MSESLEEKLKNINKIEKLKKGQAKDLEDFWITFIEPKLPKIDIVKKWHKLLLKYVKQPNCTFILRIFGSYLNKKKKDKHTLRRGFLNITDIGFKTVYIDNFLTAFIFSLAYNDYVPNYKEFKQMMDNYKFPIGYRSTKEEDKYRVFPIGKDPGIQKNGYKIAHIYPAGKDYDFFNELTTIGKFCEKYFPRGKYNDWKNTINKNNISYHYRFIKINRNERKKVYNFLVAHFLRTIDPINYFLVPKQKHIQFYVDGQMKNEIGEYIPLIRYVEYKIKKRYGHLYKQYIKLIKPINCKKSKAENIIIKATYQ